ncbi:MAG: T9SS type A sorting domain-containing protein [Bacteroidales bacterium]
MKKLSFLIFFLLPLLLCAQEKWIREYYKDTPVAARHLIETYDNGYLIVAQTKPNYPNYAILLKTDINGTPLWEKRIGCEKHDTYFLDVTEDTKGNIFACGQTSYLDKSGDPLIVKLSPCGDLIWAKIFHFKQRMSYSNEIVSDQKGGCIFTLDLTIDSPFDRIRLCHLDQYGDLIWDKFIPNWDNNVNNDGVEDLQILPDGKLALTAWGYFYPKKEDPHCFLKSSIFYLDSEANIIWRTLIGKKGIENKDLSEPYCIRLSPNGKNLYLGVRRYYDDKDANEPHLVKLDLEGNEIQSYPLHKGVDFGVCKFIFLNHKDLIGMVGYGFYNDKRQKNVLKDKKSINHFIYYTDKDNRKETDPEKRKTSFASKFDTLGKVEKEIKLSYFIPSILKTHDNKFLFLHSTDYILDENLNLILHKFNQNLEYDSIYTQKREYDFLCEHPANDEIISPASFTIVGIKENKELNNETIELKAFPNPAEKHIRIQLPSYIEITENSSTFNFKKQLFQYQNKANIQIINSLGQIVYQRKLISDEKEINLNIQDWKKGIYLLRLNFEGKQKSSFKFLKK